MTFHEIDRAAELEPAVELDCARHRLRVGRPPLIAVRTPEEKFIVHRPEEGAAEPTVHYDLLRDAAERSPRTVTGEELSRVNALVDEYLTSRLAPHEVPEAESPDEIDPSLREQLEQLGYLDAQD